MRIKKYLSPAGALNKRYTDKDFEGTGWHYIRSSDIKPDDKLLGTALKLGEEYYLAGEDGYLLPSNIVNDFLKSKDLNSYFTLQYDANDRIEQLMRLRAADRKANQLTPGAGTFVVAPVAATLTGIGGATLAPFLAPGTIGGNIIGTTAFGETLNQAMKYGTGKTLGEHAVNAAHYLGIPLSQWGDFGILMVGDLPFYVTGDLVGKQVANAGRTLTKDALDQLALDNTFKGIPINPTTKDLAKAINESVDKQSLYTPSILHKFDNPYQITKVSGDKIRLRLPSHTQEKPREVVLVPHGNNLYELHIRTWDGDHVPANLNPQEKTALFESVYNELPEGAEILFPESSADYPATRGTVAALTHLSRDPRFQRGNTTGTLTYTDKDGNLQTFTGNSFIKRLTKPAQILQQQYPEQRIYFGYFGPKHSISEVVNPDGTVNVQKAMLIANRAAYEHGGIRLLDRLENPEWHKTDSNTFLHTKEVAQRAWQMPTPAGYTKLDLMFAALGHDFGKMFAGEGHGKIGADYLRLMFPDMTDALYNAIARHMMSEDVARMQFSDQPLTLATMEADRGGAPLFRDLWNNHLTDASLDEKYLQAVKRGDFETALKLRDKHAIEVQQSNPVKGIVFAHSGHEDFNTFDASYFGKTDEGFHGKGFYFATTRVPENPSLYKRVTFGPHGEIPTMNYGPIKKYYYLYGDKIVPTGNPETNYFGTDAIAVTLPKNITIGKPAEIIVGKPNHIKLADAVTYDDNGNVIPLSQRDNFNLSDTRYWKDSFGEEILEEPYPGSDMEILAALGKGMKYGIDYRKSPEHLRQILETMGWDDLAMSEYIQEQKDLTGRISAEVSGFDEGMINKGKHRSGLNANGKVIHLILVNRDRMPTSERIIEAGVHEMGGHGMTGGISPENLHGIYLQLAEKFPRTLELMLKNEQLKNQTLVYNDTTKEILTKELYKKVEEWRKQGLTDAEIELKAILWGKLKDKKIPYISDTNEITTRAITENVIRNLGLTNSSSGKFNSLGMQEASDIFTPESLEKFIKVALSNIGITYGLSQLNQPTSNRKGGRLIPRKYK